MNSKTRNFSTDYSLLAAFLIYRRHRFLQTELDESGRPRFVFEDADRIDLDVKDFDSDPAVPIRTLARIMAPLRREANAIRRGFRREPGTKAPVSCWVED